MGKGKKCFPIRNDRTRDSEFEQNMREDNELQEWKEEYVKELLDTSAPKQSTNQELGQPAPFYQQPIMVVVQDKSWENKENVCQCDNTMKIFMPRAIEDDMVALATEIKTEFSVLLKFDRDGDKIMITEYYFPKQEATYASVNITEEFDTSWKGILHKHPDGSNFFSAVDEENIHKNFLLSLLLVGGEIKQGIFRDTCQCGGIRRRNIEMVYERDIEVSERIKELSKKIVSPCSQYQYSRYGLDYG